MTHMNSSSDVMTPEEGNDSSLDTFIRDAIGRQPLLSFSRPDDKPVQWIQLLNALDQPGTRLCQWIASEKDCLFIQLVFGLRLAYDLMWHWSHAIDYLGFCFCRLPRLAFAHSFEGAGAKVQQVLPRILFFH